MPYRISQGEAKVIKKKIAEMLEGGVIVPGNSEWAHLLS